MFWIGFASGSLSLAVKHIFELLLSITKWLAAQNYRCHLRSDFLVFSLSLSRSLSCGHAAAFTVYGWWFFCAGIFNHTKHEDFKRYQETTKAQTVFFPLDCMFFAFSYSCPCYSLDALLLFKICICWWKTRGHLCFIRNHSQCTKCISIYYFIFFLFWINTCGLVFFAIFLALLPNSRLCACSPEFPSYNRAFHRINIHCKHYHFCWDNGLVHLDSKIACKSSESMDDHSWL